MGDYEEDDLGNAENLWKVVIPRTQHDGRHENDKLWEQMWIPFRDTP